MRLVLFLVPAVDIILLTQQMAWGGVWEVSGGILRKL